MSQVEKAQKEFIRKLEKKKSSPGRVKGNYDGNRDESLYLKAAEMDDIAKEFINAHQNFTAKEWKELFNILSRGHYNEEKLMIGRILKRSRKLRGKVSLQDLDSWLNHVV